MSGSLSSRSPLEQFLRAAETPLWSIQGVGDGVVMATRDSGQVGFPWVVTVAARPPHYRAALHSPGEDVDDRGREILDVRAAPRAAGRQLRDVLVSLDEEITAN